MIKRKRYYALKRKQKHASSNSRLLLFGAGAVLLLAGALSLATLPASSPVSLLHLDDLISDAGDNTELHPDAPAADAADAPKG